MISSISSSWSAERNCFITKHLLPELFRSLNKSFVVGDLDDVDDDPDGADDGSGWASPIIQELQVVKLVIVKPMEIVIQRW